MVVCTEFWDECRGCGGDDILKVLERVADLERDFGIEHGRG